MPTQGSQPKVNIQSEQATRPKLRRHRSDGAVSRSLRGESRRQRDSTPAQYQAKKTRWEALFGLKECGVKAGGCDVCGSCGDVKHGASIICNASYRPLRTVTSERHRWAPQLRWP